MRTTVDHFTTPPAKLPWQPARGLARTIADTLTALYPGANYLVLSWDEDDDVRGSRASGTRGDGRVRLESGRPSRGSTWPRNCDGPGTICVPVFPIPAERSGDQEKRGCESVPDPAGDLAVHVEVEDALTGPDTAGVDGGTGGGARAGSAGRCCRGSGSETEETGGAEYDGCGTAHGRVLLESVGGWRSG